MAAVNPAGVGPILSPTAILVAGTDSALLSGRSAQPAAWKRDFAAPDRSIYVHTPQTITASQGEQIAFEQGDWTGTSLSGVRQAGGIYPPNGDISPAAGALRESSILGVLKTELATPGAI